MPFRTRTPIIAKTEEEFREVDYKVMGCAFDIHNEFGPHLDEIVYKNELAFRLAKNGFSAAREFGVDLSFSTYTKTVYIDLLVDNGAVYEIKTASGFASAHRTQTINYLFATGTRHGKLVNFRGPKVEGEFVSTTLDNESRRFFEVLNLGWNGTDPESSSWRTLVISLLHDWGAFLSLEWYRDALMQLTAGLSRTATMIPLRFEGRSIGSHAVRLLTSDTMWTFTATKHHSLMKTHLTRFLRLTGLSRIQWANIHNHKLVFRSISP